MPAGGVVPPAPYLMFERQIVVTDLWKANSRAGFRAEEKRASRAMTRIDTVSNEHTTVGLYVGVIFTVG